MNKNKRIDWLEIYAWLLIVLGVVVLIGGAVEIY